MTTGTPAAEFDINETLVRRLLLDQHPDLAEHAIQLLDVGWDNALYRLGDDLIVRLPRRSLSATLATHEQTWLPRLADRLPIAVPLPFRVGQPNDDYPWPWTIVPWLPGRAADLDRPASHQAERLAEFLRALHQSAPPQAPENPYRGVPLQTRAAAIDERVERLRASTDAITGQLDRVWEAALAATPTNERRWIHGDLHARNVLVENGVISGVIDWGDLTAGDVATDLASLWMLFDDERTRQHGLASYGTDQDTVLRARGWAFSYGVILLETGRRDHPRHAAMGAAILKQLVDA